MAKEVEEGFLGKVHLSQLLHASFTLLLIFEVLHLTFIVTCRIVNESTKLNQPAFAWEQTEDSRTSVETSGNIGPHCFESFSRDDLLADSGLDGNLEELAGNDFICAERVSVDPK